MIILLDTSTGLCRLTVHVDNPTHDYTYTWQADRQLADGLLEFLVETLLKHNITLTQLAGIGVFAGPGSFTGLRIGMTVLNALAADHHIPIVCTRGDNWQSIAIQRLHAGEDEQVALPFYGNDANITTPRK